MIHYKNSIWIVLKPGFKQGFMGLFHFLIFKVTSLYLIIKWVFKENTLGEHLEAFFGFFDSDSCLLEKALRSDSLIDELYSKI
jgi:hypothetical protein